MDESLIKSADLLYDLYNNAPCGFHSIDKDGVIVRINDTELEMLGYDKEEIIGKKKITELLSQKSKEEFTVNFKEFLEKGRLNGLEVEMIRKDGTILPVLISVSAIRDKNGNFKMTRTTVFDAKNQMILREKKRDLVRSVLKGQKARIKAVENIKRRIEEENRKTMEEKKDLLAQLLQSQKMEAMGILAGSIAHDFNNMLTAILGNTELVMLDLGKGHPLYEDLEAIERSAKSASDIARQLLLFSRKHEVDLTPCNLNSVVESLSRILHHLLGKNIKLKLNQEPEVWTIQGDQTQMEQILMNLLINAKDAMQDSGTITIGTANMVLNEEFCRSNKHAKAGRWVCLSVRDTGIGMSPETMQRIFEPFFTTKGNEKGTGLGLSVVYGIVENHMGFIKVDSQLGKGTEFRIYFPTEIL